jgi:hypothetical protein
MNTTLTKKESLKLIDNAYFKIKDVLESVHSGEYHYQYFQLHKKEEMNHRRFKAVYNDTCGLTTLEAVKLFYVTQIVEALFKPSWKPTIKDYLSVRQSIFMAYSLVENYKEELNKALQGINWEDILKIDYAELMK